MKIVTPEQMVELEAAAYHDGKEESDFMEEAGSGIAIAVHDYIEANEKDVQIVLLCGKGNNGGDAYAAALHLLQLDYDVTAYQLFPLDSCSPLCQQNYFQFVHQGGKVRIVEENERIEFSHSGIIIDGIFGTGFRGTVSSHIEKIIKAANHSGLPIFAIDIPSGLNGLTGTVEGAAIVATITLFLELPKRGFFLRQGWNHVGRLLCINFGLSPGYIKEVDSPFIMLSPDMISPLFPPLMRNRHKYQAGVVVGLAGSPSLPGAALLSSMAALKGGAGIMKLLYPKGMEIQLAASPYEIIKVAYDSEKSILEEFEKADGLFIGPGLGLTKQVKQMLKKIIPKLKTAVVLDADAITVIAEEKIPLPQNAILTPHMGELGRLLVLKENELTESFLKQCQEYATDNNVTLVVKGAPSFIFHPNRPVYICPHGDPGMATAGSGDVLTGLIAALLAQGNSCLNAALLGVYLHGLAGELAAEELTSYCMTAGDILDFFPESFKSERT